ncbi:MAG: S9 family peptidase [Cyanothece sp. SIO1E1]|nr:S9 family peptidase [Cyanothece sp. SIO1E1]
MKVITSILLFGLFSSICAWSQNGKLLEKKALEFSDSTTAQLIEALPEFETIKFSKLTYLSDGLKVTAYLAEPKAEGQYPCIIANRGGNRDFGQWNPISVGFFLGKMASWGYVVVASQYRGNDGGEGVEQFGGDDVNDVINLLPLLVQIPAADTSRIGLEGGSRGGMMAYQTLRESCRFKAAAVLAGVTNSFTSIADRPEMEKYVYAELVPDYPNNKEQELQKRSAVFWADEICKTTPLLIMHGSADWRVSALQSMELVQKLYAYRHPVRFILFEGADHGIREFRKDMFHELRRHFDYYVRDGNPLPNMEPHGR